MEPTARGLELLSDYPWPGNIRELHAVIDRTEILGNGSSLEVAKAIGISSEFCGVTMSSTDLEPTLQWSPTDRTIESQVNLPTLDQAMKAYTERALAVTQVHIEGERGTAKPLDINPHTLRARMGKLGISWSVFRP